MQNLSLHFPQGRTADRALGTGVHRIVREASGTIGVGDAVPGALLVQFSLDRRGLWLQVPPGMRGIHVNGRPVRRMALLRPGDAVYADGVEVLVRGQAPRPLPSVPLPNQAEPDPRVVLRGIGGRHHGRAFPIGGGCSVGAGREADIVLDAPHLSPQHAVLGRSSGGVLLRHLQGGVTSVVNGMPVHEAVLHAGDQVAFDPQSRFVVEIPWNQADPADPAATETTVSAPVPDALASRASLKRWPWLLLAAAVLAGVLALLLLFAPA